MNSLKVHSMQSVINLITSEGYQKQNQHVEKNTMHVCNCGPCSVRIVRTSGAIRPDPCPL